MQSFDKSEKREDGRTPGAPKSKSDAVPAGHGETVDPNTEFLRQFRAWEASKLPSDSISPIQVSVDDDNGAGRAPSASGQGGNRGHRPAPNRPVVRGFGSNPGTTSQSTTKQNQPRRDISEQQVIQELREYYPWALKKVRENDNSDGQIHELLDAREWLSAPLNRAVRVSIAQEMRSLGYNEERDPAAFKSALNGRVVDFLRQSAEPARHPAAAARLQDIKTQLKQRLDGAPTEEVVGKEIVEHWSNIRKMVASCAVSLGAAVSAIWGCSALEVPHFMQIGCALGAAFLNLQLCQVWYKRRDANEFQNLDKLLNEAKTAETLERKLAYTGALYHIVDEYGLQKPILQSLFPSFAERYEWWAKEPYQKLTSTLQKLRKAGRAIAEELIRTGTSFEHEVRVDKAFGERLGDFESDFKQIKNHWAAYPDSALGLAKTGVILGCGYAVLRLGEFAIASGYGM